MKGVTELAAYGDNIDKMSQKMGLSAEAYQEWDAIMQHSGTSIESLQAGMKTLANAVENGNKAFGRLGITEEQLASMNNEELFSTTITALQNVENETERTYLAGQLLGRGATELGALLNTSAEDTEAMRKRVHELGGVMSDEAVKASAAFQDSLQDLQTGISGMSRGMLADFLPAITQVMDGMTMLLTGDESGLDQISQGIDAFIGNLNQAAPRIFEVGGQLMGSLVQAITSNLPSLISSGTQIIIQFVSGALDMLPDVASAAVEIITTLAGGIAEALPELIPAAIDAILQIIETLTDPDNLSGLIDAALAIILALADGLINALPRLLEKAPVIVDKLVTALANNLPKITQAGVELVIKLALGIANALPKIIAMGPQIINSFVSGAAQYFGNLLSLGSSIVGKAGDGIRGVISSARGWGRDLISGFVDGIKSSISMVTNAVRSVANKVTSFLHFSRPDEGPLRDYETWMPDFMAGLAAGIDANAWRVQDALKDATASMAELPAPAIDDFSGSYSNTTASGQQITGSAGNIGGITININGIQFNTVEELARVLSAEVQHAVERSVNAFGSPAPA